MARRYSPEHHTVTARVAFPDGAMATEAPLGAAVFVERWDAQTTVLDNNARNVIPYLPLGDAARTPAPPPPVPSAQQPQGQSQGQSQQGQPQQGQTQQSQSQGVSP